MEILEWRYENGNMGMEIWEWRYDIKMEIYNGEYMGTHENGEMVWGGDTLYYGNTDIGMDT